MFLNGLPFVVLLLAPCGASGEQGHNCTMMHHASSRHAAIAEVTRGVNQYMSLRWMLEAPLGPDTLCADPEETHRALSDIANAIRSERTAARTGDIFTPAVAGFFRQQISAALNEDGHQLQTYLEDPTTGIPIDLPTVEVNGMIPWGVGDQLWPSLMTKLPALPAELEYRLVGRDLVLLDASIDLVVDIVENIDSMSNMLPGRPGCCSQMHGGGH